MAVLIPTPGKIKIWAKLRLRKEGLRRVVPMLLISLLTIAFISACSSTDVEHSTIQITKPSSIPCRVVQHAMGEACIPNNPQRVVTLLQHILGHTLVLGVKPIGANVRSIEQLDGNYMNNQTYLGNRTEGIVSLGLNESEGNLERMLLLKPDLILAVESVRDTYPLLSQIAPVVIVPSKDVVLNWKEGFNFIAKILGKEEKAQQALVHYYQRIEDLKIALGDRYKDQKISVCGSAGFSMFAFTKGGFSGSILSDLGLQRPAAQNISTVGAIYNISEEMLEQVDGDVLFFLAFDKQGRADFERLQQRPLWKKLKAVQKNQVYLVNSYTWTGSNLLAADLVIDDLYKYLVNTP
ncbi:MAG: iron-siderophore ABC transporter substrate-binding protein [Nostoc sp. LLA-1]|nr:iron-siderophore ABC transporter substrate-binding protein [Cyanocohniella sp. LLY]